MTTLSRKKATSSIHGGNCFPDGTSNVGKTKPCAPMALQLPKLVFHYLQDAPWMLKDF